MLKRGTIVTYKSPMADEVAGTRFVIIVEDEIEPIACRVEDMSKGYAVVPRVQYSADTWIEVGEWMDPDCVTER